MTLTVCNMPKLSSNEEIQDSILFMESFLDNKNLHSLIQLDIKSQLTKPLISKSKNCRAFHELV